MRQRQDFLHLQRAGRRHRAPHVVLLVGRPRTPQAEARVGLTVSARVGNAVVRNLVRRRLRVVVRREAGQLQAGRDHVWIALPGADRLPFQTLAEEVVGLLAASGRQALRHGL